MSARYVRDDPQVFGLDDLPDSTLIHMVGLGLFSEVCRGYERIRFQNMSICYHLCLWH